MYVLHEKIALLYDIIWQASQKKKIITLSPWDHGPDILFFRSIPLTKHPNAVFARAPYAVYIREERHREHTLRGITMWKLHIEMFFHMVRRRENSW